MVILFKWQKTAVLENINCNNCQLASVHSACTKLDFFWNETEIFHTDFYKTFLSDLIKFQQIQQKYNRSLKSGRNDSINQNQFLDSNISSLFGLKSDHNNPGETGRLPAECHREDQGVHGGAEQQDGGGALQLGGGRRHPAHRLEDEVLHC